MELPVLEDVKSVQVAIMQVIGLLLSGQVEHKTAALLLYALQTASSNLRSIHYEDPREIVIDPAAVSETRMGEKLWKDSDFANQPREGHAREAPPKKPSLSAPEEDAPLPADWAEKKRAELSLLIREANLEQYIK